MSFSESNRRNRRGQRSLNHLLNFSYEHTQDYSNFDKPHFRQKKKGRPMPKSKEQFVLANFQFVVRPPSRVNNANSGHYFTAKLNPDVLVEWSTIELIRTITNDEIICPICMEHPVAAKITICGHVFCYHCILHYLSMGDTSYRKCPTCNESVTLESLKSLQILPALDGNLKLLRRPKNSIIPCFIDQEEPDDIFPPFDDEIARFSRYTIINDIKTIIDKELREMEEAVSGMELSESAYIDLARDQVNARLQEWQHWASIHLIGNYVNHKAKHHGHSHEHRSHHEHSEQSPITSYTNEVIFHDDEHDQTHDHGHENSHHQVSHSHSQSLSQKIHDLPYYYFYQSSDGSALFLHPINLKMLIQEFDADMSKLPSILPMDKILEIESIELTEEKRRLYGMVRHIPLGADIRFVEIDLSQIVSRQTMHDFSRTLQARANKRVQRAQKLQREKEEERLREEEMERARQYEIEQRKQNLSIESFPAWQEIVSEEEQLDIKTTIPAEKKSKPHTNAKTTWGIKDITRTESEKLFGTYPMPVMELQGAWAERNQQLSKKPKNQVQKNNEKPSSIHSNPSGAWVALSSQSTSRSIGKSNNNVSSTSGNKKKKVVLLVNGNMPINK